ncbi:hypothetical protein BLNAU_21505 [Blattamonas nauphoetae]|uniref:Uncharacterized protein n=1 Tax=Blattamonas nauphoetae TaxID=2049346 RepID=A0ABQ9WVQ8_9EUKA|nr:hypothetical protein BLNAU_21505 [Blattamonas nauphoetae]
MSITVHKSDVLSQLSNDNFRMSPREVGNRPRRSVTPQLKHSYRDDQISLTQERREQEEEKFKRFYDGVLEREEERKERNDARFQQFYTNLLDEHKRLIPRARETATRFDTMSRAKASSLHQSWDSSVFQRIQEDISQSVDRKSRNIRRNRDTEYEDFLRTSTTLQLSPFKTQNRSRSQSSNPMSHSMTIPSQTTMASSTYKSQTRARSGKLDPDADVHVTYRSINPMKDPLSNADYVIKQEENLDYSPHSHFKATKPLIISPFRHRTNIQPQRQLVTSPSRVRPAASHPASQQSAMYLPALDYDIQIPQSPPGMRKSYVIDWAQIRTGKEAESVTATTTSEGSRAAPNPKKLSQRLQRTAHPGSSHAKPEKAKPTRQSVNFRMWDRLDDIPEIKVDKPCHRVASPFRENPLSVGKVLNQFDFPVGSEAQSLEWGTRGLRMCRQSAKPS